MPSVYERDMNAKMPTFVHDTTTLHVGMFYLLTYVTYATPPDATTK